MRYIESFIKIFDIKEKFEHQIKIHNSYIIPEISRNDFKHSTEKLKELTKTKVQLAKFKLFPFFFISLSVKYFAILYILIFIFNVNFYLKSLCYILRH